MSATLAEILLAPQTKPAVIADCFTLIDQELSDKSGIAAGALKVGYKTAANFAPGYLSETLSDLLPQIVEKLEPFWVDFTASGGSEFGDYLAKRGGEVSEALLSVTDAQAEISDHPAIVKAYRAVRGSAAKHVEAALPRVGDLVLKYAG